MLCSGKFHLTSSRNFFYDLTFVLKVIEQMIQHTDFPSYYRQEHKEKIMEQTRIWKQENKNRVHKQVECECGVVIDKNNLSTHRKSNKHNELLKQK